MDDKIVRRQLTISNIKTNLRIKKSADEKDI